MPGRRAGAAHGGCRGDPVPAERRQRRGVQVVSLAGRTDPVDDGQLLQHLGVRQRRGVLLRAREVPARGGACRAATVESIDLNPTEGLTLSFAATITLYTSDVSSGPGSTRSDRARRRPEPEHGALRTRPTDRHGRGRGRRRGARRLPAVLGPRQGGGSPAHRPPLTPPGIAQPVPGGNEPPIRLLRAVLRPPRSSPRRGRRPAAGSPPVERRESNNGGGRTGASPTAPGVGPVETSAVRPSSSSTCSNATAPRASRSRSTARSTTWRSASGSRAGGSN